LRRHDNHADFFESNRAGFSDSLVMSWITTNADYKFEILSRFYRMEKALFNRT